MQTGRRGSAQFLERLVSLPATSHILTERETPWAAGRKKEVAMGAPVTWFEINTAESKAVSEFYTEVDDPQAYLDRIEQAGGRTVVPVTEIPDMVTFAQFADPQGNVVGLVKSSN
jgi:predicted enzyme related to lactoylglutathione lyase